MYFMSSKCWPKCVFDACKKKKKRKKSTTLFSVIFLTSMEIMEGLGNEESGELYRYENEKN